MTLPATQAAVQITGVDEVTVNRALPVPALSPHGVLLKVEACGICFSDTKLAHAWLSHPRKSEVVGVVVNPEVVDTFDPTLSEADLLAEVRAIPSYAGGTAPVVPGHETVARIVAVGSAVKRHQAGERVLVETDYRHLPTASSNAAFGYTFNGGLEQYTLVDERVATDLDGSRFLIPVSEAPTRSAVALVEPWACVEAAYAWGERQALTPGGRLLVVADPGHAVEGLDDLIAAGQPGTVTVVGSDFTPSPDGWSGLVFRTSTEGLDGEFDDIAYFGANAGVAESLAARLAKNGLMALALGGARFSQPVQADVGRVHYDLIRFTATPGASIAEAYARIPAVCEIRPGERVAVIGAAGPMGLMHTLRTATCGVPGISLDAVDVDDARLAHLAGTVAPVAERHGVAASFRNSKTSPLEPGYSYIALMVPAPALLAQAVGLAGDGAILNCFAGFAIGTMAPLDFNAIAGRGLYLVGTSGSRIQDMKAMLAKLENGVLDTNVSLDAVCGLAGVPEALDAVRGQKTGGKIMVYPDLVDLPLVRLADLAEKLPAVAAQMDGPRWTQAAEQALLALA